MDTKETYFYKKKIDRFGNGYIVVTDKPAIKIGKLKGFEFASRVQGLRYGTIKLSSIDGHLSFKVGEKVSGFIFTDEAIEGHENLYKVLKSDIAG